MIKEQLQEELNRVLDDQDAMMDERTVYIESLQKLISELQVENKSLDETFKIKQAQEHLTKARTAESAENFTQYCENLKNNLAYENNLKKRTINKLEDRTFFETIEGPKEISFMDFVIMHVARKKHLYEGEDSGHGNILSNVASNKDNLISDYISILKTPDHHYLENIVRFISLKEERMQELLRAEEFKRAQYRNKLRALKVDSQIMKAKYTDLKELQSLAQVRLTNDKLVQTTTQLKIHSTNYRVNFERKAFKKISKDIGRIFGRMKKKLQDCKDANEILREEQALLQIKIRELEDMNNDLLQIKQNIIENTKRREQMGEIRDYVMNLVDQINTVTDYINSSGVDLDLCTSPEQPVAPEFIMLNRSRKVSKAEHKSMSPDESSGIFEGDISPLLSEKNEDSGESGNKGSMSNARKRANKVRRTLQGSLFNYVKFHQIARNTRKRVVEKDIQEKIQWFAYIPKIISNLESFLNFFRLLTRQGQEKFRYMNNLTIEKKERSGLLMTLSSRLKDFQEDFELEEQEKLDMFKMGLKKLFAKQKETMKKKQATIFDNLIYNDSEMSSSKKEEYKKLSNKYSEERFYGAPQTGAFEAEFIRMNEKDAFKLRLLVSIRRMYHRLLDILHSVLCITSLGNHSEDFIQLLKKHLLNRRKFETESTTNNKRLQLIIDKDETSKDMQPLAPLYVDLVTQFMDYRDNDFKFWKWTTKNCKILISMMKKAHATEIITSLKNTDVVTIVQELVGEGYKQLVVKVEQAGSALYELLTKIQIENDNLKYYLSRKKNYGIRSRVASQTKKKSLLKSNEIVDRAKAHSQLQVKNPFHLLGKYNSTPAVAKPKNRIFPWSMNAEELEGLLENSPSRLDFEDEEGREETNLKSTQVDTGTNQDYCPFQDEVEQPIQQYPKTTFRAEQFHRDKKELNNMFHSLYSFKNKLLAPEKELFNMNVTRPRISGKYLTKYLRRINSIVKKGDQKGASFEVGESRSRMNSSRIQFVGDDGRLITDSPKGHMKFFSGGLDLSNSKSPEGFSPTLKHTPASNNVRVGDKNEDPQEESNPTISQAARKLQKLLIQKSPSLPSIRPMTNDSGNFLKPSRRISRDNTKNSFRIMAFK